MRNLSKYFNTAAHGIMGEAVLNARIDAQKYIAEHGAAAMPLVEKTALQTRQQLAGLVLGKAEHIALISNFSWGFERFLSLVADGSSVFLIEDDYPSLIFPISQRNLRVSIFAPSKTIEKTLLDEIEKSKPDYLMLSSVQYLNGLYLDPEFYISVKELSPQTIVVVDVTQAIGQMPVVMDGIDVMVGSCYKWLEAGFGIGFIALSTQAVELHGMADDGSLGRGSLLGFYTPGHVDHAATAGLGVAIQEYKNRMLKEHELVELRNFLRTELSNMNLLEPIVCKRRVHSGIFNLKLDEHAEQHLLAQGFEFSRRGKGVRIALAHYHTKDDVEGLLRELLKLG